MMKANLLQYQLNDIAQKQIKDIKGFYAHFIGTFIILPFLVFVNLFTVPQFHWFWYAIVLWGIGLIIHWISVFGFSKMSFTKVQFNKEKKGFDTPIEVDVLKEKYSYENAKKRTNEIRNFYIHFVVSAVVFPIILFVNLQFVPNFHFFWLALGGIIISIFFHWLEVFGFEFLGFGRKWETRKIQEIIKQYQ